MYDVMNSMGMIAMAMGIVGSWWCWWVGGLGMVCDVVWWEVGWEGGGLDESWGFDGRWGCVCICLIVRDVCVLVA